MNTIVDDERDVGGGGLPEQVEHDDHERAGPIGMSVDGGMERVAEPAAVEQVLDRPDRAEQGRQPAVVEVAERSRPAVVDRHEPRQQSGHASPPERVYARSGAGCHPTATSPQTVHIGRKLGDKVDAVPAKFVDKAVVAWPRRYISSCPKGQVRTARPARGAILGTVPGTRFEGRKASERGTWAERRDSGLVRSRGEPTGRSSHQFLRALSCVDGVRAVAALPARPRRRRDLPGSDGPVPLR